MNNFDPLIQSAARLHGLPVRLVKAIVEVESGGNPWAVRYEPMFYSRYIQGKKIHNIPPCSNATEERLRAHSFGLMQIMGATAREAGFKGAYLAELCEPDVNLEWCCRYLAGLVKKHGGVEPAVAAYNAGSPRKGIDGRWVNQAYVDKVRKAGGLP